MPLISVKVKYYEWNDIDHYDFSYFNTCKINDLEKISKNIPYYLLNLLMVRPYLI